MGNSISRRDAEDAVQEAFLELARQSKAPDDMLGWMVRVVRNRVLDWIRSEDRRQKRESTYRDQRPTWFVEPILDTGIDAERLQSVLQSLPEIPRQIIVMHAWGGMTFQQIATELQTSSSSVHRWYQNGLRMMRERLESAAENHGDSNQSSSSSRTRDFVHDAQRKTS